MNISDENLMEIANTFLRCEDVIENNWSEFSFVFEFCDGCISNSGFLYLNENITPAIADIEDEPVFLDDILEALREQIYQQSGHKFNQLLFQMDNKTKRFKIDFEFDDPTRWAITPNNMFEMREKLRPKFD